MAASAEFREFVRDLFRDLGPVRTRAMFGGAGVYLDDAMFGLIADDTLFLKTDDALAARLGEAGSRPFVYEGQGKRIEMSYWRMPESALDDPDEALDWARAALVPAEAAAAEKRARKARRR